MNLLVETMTMLLQLFFVHQCISMPEIIDWYLNDNFVDESIGKKLEKNWAESFLHLHGYSIEFKSMHSWYLYSFTRTFH